MFKKKSANRTETPALTRIPRHVAIIMDGNNRWARQRGLPGSAGHKSGLDSVRKVMEACNEAGVEVLTLFAFSSENWQRSEDEVSSLMTLFINALKREVKRLNKNNIRLRIIGDRSRFSDTLLQHIESAEAQTAANDGCMVVVAADYGGRWDIAQAARKLAQQVAEGQLQPEAITEELLASEICLADLPPPDLCIRTGGELRISNFLLWQFAYTELYFTDLYWPDFDQQAFYEALEDYAGRERRFGRSGGDS